MIGQSINFIWNKVYEILDGAFFLMQPHNWVFAKCLNTMGFVSPEDEQLSKMTSQKALHNMTMERDAALADLNSVERSLSDVFRRYENMKSTLEGFKKVR